MAAHGAVMEMKSSTRRCTLPDEDCRAEDGEDDVLPETERGVLPMGSPGFSEETSTNLQGHSGESKKDSCGRAAADEAEGSGSSHRSDTDAGYEGSRGHDADE